MTSFTKLNIWRSPVLSASFILTIALAFSSSYLHAHPHNWINVKTEFIVDDRGQLTDLLQYWEFDIYYSAIHLADIGNEYDNQQQGLNKLAAKMVENLQRYKYFSALKIDAESLSLGKPNDYSLTTTFKDGNQQLLLSMRFSLDESLPIGRKKLLWRVFDPTYYIDMKHHTRSQILIRNSSHMKCVTTIDVPTPSAEIIDYASRLDSSMKETQGLGSYFAEKILIHCI